MTVVAGGIAAGEKPKFEIPTNFKFSCSTGRVL